jgi:hypothetical protein
MVTSDERTLVVLVVLGLCCVSLYRMILWVKEAPRTADPWEKETDEAINGDEALPLCVHCLTPQEHNGWFCPNCGATVGPFSNYMPFVYVFSAGEVLRAGVTEHMRSNWVIRMGYILISIGMFALAAPIYLFFLFKNLRRSRGAQGVTLQ